MISDDLVEQKKSDEIRTPARVHKYKNGDAINHKLAELWKTRSERFGIDLSKSYGHVSVLPLIVFLHISKTAGSSFLLTLQKNFDESFMYNITDEATFEAECESKLLLERLKLITGHGSFHLRIDQKTKRDCCYITILRDPLDRLVSLYYYLLSIADVSEAGKMMVETKMTLKEFVQYKENQVTDNSMLRMLCNIEGKTAKWGECTEQMLEDAKHNLIHYFDFVGFTDEFADFSHQLCNFFNWEEAKEKSNVNNERRSTAELDPEIVSLIKEVNRFDFALYDFAKEHFSLQSQR